MASLGHGSNLKGRLNPLSGRTYLPLLSVGDLISMNRRKR